MVTGISTATRTEVLGAIRSRYREASKRDKSRMLDEFVAMAGCHRKHAVRLLGLSERSTDRSVPKGRRIYDEAVRQALIVVWEASDRICGKRLKAALPSMVQSLERHGHLDLDPDVRERLFAASASTMDRLLRPVRERAGSRRRRKRRRKMGSRVPVRTFMDWNEPGPSYLEIDLVAHGGGAVSGSYIHSLVATDISSGWTEAVPLLTHATVRALLGHGCGDPPYRTVYDDQGAYGLPHSDPHEISDYHMPKPRYKEHHSPMRQQAKMVDVVHTECGWPWLAPTSAVTANGLVSTRYNTAAAWPRNMCFGTSRILLVMPPMPPLPMCRNLDQHSEWRSSSTILAGLSVLSACSSRFQVGRSERRVQAWRSVERSGQ